MSRYLLVITLVCTLFLGGCTFPTGNDKETSRVNASGNEESIQETVKDHKSTLVSESNKESDKSDVAANTVMMPVTLYYQDMDGYLTPMTRWIDKQPGIANATVSGLIDSAITREELQYYGVYPVLPVNTDILGINIKEGTATIDFNKEILEYASPDIERNIITSIVYTLTEFSTINKIRIKVNGYTVDKMKFGTDISKPLGRADLPINSKIALGVPKAEIYCFKKVNEGFTYLVPVSVEGEGLADVNAGSLLKLLTKGNTDNKLQSEIPEGTVLQEYFIKNGVLVLDFNGKFLEYGGSSREEGILKQIAYTVKQLRGISLIKLTVNGKAAQLPEGTEISSGIAIPKTINDYIDR